MRRILKFLDDNLLAILAGFLLFFIPLYPKLPLFEVLPGYIVRVRLEDILIAVTFIVYIIYVLRKKATFWHTPLTKPILLYLFLGGLSLITAITIVGSIPLEALHIKKALLHYLRRIEYFSLFFIFYSSTKSLRHAKTFLIVYLITITGVTIYGYGQKYLYWPAFSTMNREFAKGWKLYLTAHARVISTFGGHYDLAAFTMVALAVLWSLFFGVKKFFSRLIFFLILAGSFWLIILTASRVSFISYLVALTGVIFIWMFKRGFKWAASRWVVSTMLSILIMLSFGDLSERFLHLVKLDDRFGGIRKLLLSPRVQPPAEGQPFDPLAAVTTKSDQPPSPIKPGTGKAAKPPDVIDDIDYINVKDAAGNIVAKPVKRTFSPLALKFDLSTGIRLDALWPRAWQGFLRNPLLGSGYSTLTKARVTDFTEAESTDNDYLRALGETGALGTIAFFAIIVSLMLQIWWALPGVRDQLFFAFLIGGLGGTVGLLINALYIDVFEASKVAMSFWALSGVLLGGISSKAHEIAKNRKPFRLIIPWKLLARRLTNFIKTDKFFLLLLLCLAFVVRLYRFTEPLADWHSWRQADTSAVTRNFIRHGINLLYPTYDDLSSVASGKPNPRGLRMVEFPIYNAISAIVDKLIQEITIEQSGRLTSILASLGSLTFLFFLVRKYANRRVAIFTGFFFALLPFNIYYSRVVLPEPLMVFTSLGMIFYFDRWIEISKKSKIKNQKFPDRRIGVLYTIALVFAATSLLIKPYAAFFFLPLLYLVVRNYGFKGIFSWSVIGFFILAVVPFIGWRWWVSHFPEGIPAYMWLFNGDGIRFKGAFFYWLFADRIGRLILGYWGLPLLVLGIIARPTKKAGWFFHVWLIAILLYLFTFATGNVRHDYYQIITIPIITIFLALGCEAILTISANRWNRKIAIVSLFILIPFTLAFSWYHVRDFFNINHPEIVAAGREADKILNPHGLVIAPYGGDTAFLYQINRAGWPLMEGTIDQMIAKGAHYYVSVKDDELTQSLVKEALRKDKKKPYKLLKKTSQYTIIQLVDDRYLP